MTPEEQVARVLAEHDIIREPCFYPEHACSCGGWDGWTDSRDTADEARRHVAAEVVKALGLREERSLATSSTYEWELVRLVTDWREVES